MLHIDSHWVWDSWYIAAKQHHHVFYLQAPRSLGDPHARHHAASIGHATSIDLVEWTLHRTALQPHAGPAWDDQATWTGCVVEAPDGSYVLYYTGIGRADHCREQRIGIAVSEDLEIWTRWSDGPAVIADPRWYETDPAQTIDGVAWRDPWVFTGPDGRWHMLVTASAAGWPAATGGVIGHAVSDDMFNWEVLPPLTQPGTARCLEVPQVAEVGDRFVLVYSVPRPETAGDALPQGDIWCADAEGPLGPFDTNNSWKMDETGLYAGRLVRVGDSWKLMGFINSYDDEFIGALDDPRPVDVDTLRASSVPRPGASSGAISL
jgi:beta-fructofuranosidase